MSAPEKAEVVTKVSSSPLPKRKVLRELGIPKSTYYRWLRRQDQQGLEDRPGGDQPPWNRLTIQEECSVLLSAREMPELSCRQLAAWITDNQGFSVSESSVYRILGREGLAGCGKGGLCEYCPVDGLRNTTMSGHNGSLGHDYINILGDYYACRCPQDTVTYTFSDGGSGIDQASGDLGPHVLTGEGQGLSDSGLAVDLAGNSASYTVTGISIDKTAPDITIVVPEDGAEYVLLEEVLASWSASDTLSGMASTTAPVADGTAIDTSTEGSILFEVVATDTAGNISSVTHSYTVLSPAEAAGNMVQTVADLDLPAGAEGSLTAKLDAAIAALDRGSDKAAVNNLNAFKNYVRAQSGKKINESDADTLIAEAERIIAAIEAG